MMSDTKDKCVSVESVHIVMYTDVKNMKQLKERAVESQLQIAVIKPGLLLEKFQLMVAVHKSVRYPFHKMLKAKNVIFDIMYYLLPSNRLQAMQTFTVDDTDENCIVVIYDPEDTELKNEFLSAVEGRMIPTECISEFTDLPLVKEVYGITYDWDRDDVFRYIISKMAIKEYW